MRSLAQLIHTQVGMLHEIESESNTQLHKITTHVEVEKDRVDEDEEFTVFTSHTICLHFH